MRTLIASVFILLGLGLYAQRTTIYLYSEESKAQVIEVKVNQKKYNFYKDRPHQEYLERVCYYERKVSNGVYAVYKSGYLAYFKKYKRTTLINNWLIKNCEFRSK